MRLTDLEPRWWADGDGRHGQGISFLCPCAVCRDLPTPQRARLGVAFAQPIDGLEPYRLTPLANLRLAHDSRVFDVPPGFLWHRQGHTFEVLTLTPSVDASPAGHWHGWIRNGEVTTC